jgi:DNA repair exonuclease SbcCD ATPase subunit
MRFYIPIFALWAALPATAQESAAAPAEQLRTSVREWVETMRKIQEEENAWTRDKDVLQGYKEGLEKEIEDLKEEIGRARTRREGGDKQSLDKLAERDLYAKAQEDLARQLRVLEEALAAKLPLFPAPLREIPKVSLAIETLQNSLQLPPEKQTQDVSKRLFNATELLAEVEKFQQQVHVHTELRKDSEDREFKMQMVYFGLAMAYGVNEDGSFAVTGRPSADGWKFQENKALASGIQELVKAASDEKHAAFNKLPLVIP